MWEWKEEERGEPEEPDVDEIIEKLRRSQDLDEHEQRLLGCIVDTGGLFDSVRNGMLTNRYFPQRRS